MFTQLFSRALPALIVASIFSSCGNGNTAQQGSGTPSVPDTATHRVSNTGHSRPPAGDNASLVTNARTMIIGEWVDVTDPKSVLIFTAGKQISMYDGKDADSIDYNISSHNCMGDTAGRANDIYLQTDLCYAIDNIDQHTLSLMYLDRGNILTYERKK